LSETLKNWRGIAHCVSNFVSIAIRSGNLKRAAVLIGAEEALRDRMHVPLPPGVLEAYRSDAEMVRLALGPTDCDALTASGRALPTDKVIAYAASLKTELP
jgi:hypothetical protein